MFFRISWESSMRAEVTSIAASRTDLRVCQISMLRQKTQH